MSGWCVQPRGKENERLSLVIQTICATGIRVSKLGKFITVEAVQRGGQRFPIKES